MTVEASKKLLAEAQKNFAKWRGLSPQLGRVGIFYTSWYPEIISGLTESARGFLNDVGVDESKIDRVQVSGSWELPLAIQSYLARGGSSFAIALGCIVEGETPHFDILCSTVTDALMTLQLEQRVPIGFGVLTVKSIEQAAARLNKGAEAAEAAFRSWLLVKEH